MIIFGSILTTFESTGIFGGGWGSFENCLEPKIEFSSPKCVKRSVDNYLKNGQKLIITLISCEIL